MTDDRHPEELLAGYVDGALSDEERAAVESHLAGCARCRQESGLATRAVATLRTIDEEPVPVGVMSPVHQEIARRRSRPAPRPLSQRVVWAAGGAVAAAFIGLLAIWVLPGMSGNSTGSAATPGTFANASGAAGGEGAEGNATTAPKGSEVITIEQRSTNYDDPALAHLATRTADDIPKGPMSAAFDRASQPQQTLTALQCVEKGAQVESQDVLVRLISASYKGAPAYIAVYETGPSPTGRPSSVLVWVINAKTCAFASFTSARV
jgi:predicted anti-sigma-YlaC factor YlaD